MKVEVISICTSAKTYLKGSSKIHTTGNNRHGCAAILNTLWGEGVVKVYQPILGSIGAVITWWRNTAARPKVNRCMHTPVPRSDRVDVPTHWWLLSQHGVRCQRIDDVMAPDIDMAVDTWRGPATIGKMDTSQWASVGQLGPLAVHIHVARERKTSEPCL